MFQLTALIVRGPVTSGERFTINLDCVMIHGDEVRGALLCVQVLVRSPHFTQRNFFSDSGIAMLAGSAAICDSITSSAVFEPWSHVETTSRSQVVAEVCACVIRLWIERGQSRINRSSGMRKVTTGHLQKIPRLDLKISKIV